MLTAAEIAGMQATQNTAMPGTVVIRRFVMTSDGMGGFWEVWDAVGTVAGRIYPQNSRAFAETVTGAQVTSITRWFATLPVGTSVTAKDRLSYNGRTWEVVQVNNSEMWQTAVRCEVVAFNEESRLDTSNVFVPSISTAEAVAASDAATIEPPLSYISATEDVFTSDVSSIGTSAGWLIRDEFTTDRAVGNVNGTDAEPGPGTRTAAGDVSIASGALVVGTGSVVYGAIARQAGLLVIAKYAVRAARSVAGWHDGAAARIYGIEGGLSNYLRSPGPFLTTANAVANDIVVVAVRGTAGCMAFINNRLLYINLYSTAASLLPGVTGSTTGDTWAWLRVPNTVWLPTPLASDGFGSAFGTTDGLGHAEGVAGGLGAGGSGLAWTQQAGTWGISSNKAVCSATSGGIGIATVTADTIHVFVGAGLTRSTGEIGLILRYADANNYIKVLHNGTNAQLIKVVAGTPTTLVNAAATYSAGARMWVRADGTAFRLYYNEALIGAQQTIADASLQTSAACGLYTNNTTDTADNFVVYACGNEGQYDVLTDWSE